MLVKIWVINEASAAPLDPNNGIKKKFNTMFNKAAEIYKYFKYFCLFSHTIQAFLATPKYEKAVYQVTIRKGATAPKYEFPYKKEIPKFANNIIKSDTNNEI